MSFGDPIEFIRNLLNGDRQRVGNRVKKEAFIIEATHCAWALNDNVVINLPAVAGHHWRFDAIHFSYDGQGPAGILTVADGVTNYLMVTPIPGPVELRFDTVRWAQGAGVTIVLNAGGAGVTGTLNVLGARYERLEGDF